MNQYINMRKHDIRSVVENFKVKSMPQDRYTSFDYCYNYFKNGNNLKNDIEKSCLVLGFYLASWGMFRGSSFLLQKSVKTFEKTIEYINRLNKSIWEIDVDKYDSHNIATIIETYEEIRSRLVPNDKTHLTLVTKTLLGIFGFIPAYDNYFCNTFRALTKNKCGFRTVNQKSLRYIKEFYLANKGVIDKLAKETPTTDFISEKKTNTYYTKAKIIDMYGFNIGLNMANQKSKL